MEIHTIRVGQFGVWKESRTGKVEDRCRFTHTYVCVLNTVLTMHLWKFVPQVQKQKKKNHNFGHYLTLYDCVRQQVEFYTTHTHPNKSLTLIYETSYERLRNKLVWMNAVMKNWAGTTTKTQAPTRTQTAKMEFNMIKLRALLNCKHSHLHIG